MTQHLPDRRSAARHATPHIPEGPAPEPSESWAAARAALREELRDLRAALQNGFDWRDLGLVSVHAAVIVQQKYGGHLLLAKTPVGQQVFNRILYRGELFDVDIVSDAASHKYPIRINQVGRLYTDVKQRSNVHLFPSVIWAAKGMCETACLPEIATRLHALWWRNLGRHTHQQKVTIA